MAENEQLPKGMIPMPKNADISMKDVDYAGILLRKIEEIKGDFNFNLLSLQINEGEGKSPTIALVLQVLPKEVKDALSK